MAKKAPRLQTTPTRIAALMGALIGLGVAAALYALRPTNACNSTRQRAPSAPRTVPSKKFMRGEPMKPATKVLAGLS